MPDNLVFVYGTLKKGFGNHGVLNPGSQFICKDRIRGWDMYSLGGFPAITEGTGEISGELYSVDEKVLARCDILEGYPNFYDRMIVRTASGMRAWVYFINDLNNCRSYGKVDGGVWNGKA